MTNYEWLDHKKRLVEFINDLGGERPMIRSEFCEKYGIPYETYAADYADEYEGAYDNFAEAIVDWLEQERPTKKYIEFDAAIRTIGRAEAKFPGAVVVTAYAHELIRQFEELEKIELEE